MNEFLQKHGCSNVFAIPEGLKELMSDISREVLRAQPPKLYEFIANYLSCLLITREHGFLAIKVLDDLCDCQPTVSEHLIQIGLETKDAKDVSVIIKNEVEVCEDEADQAKLREAEIVKKIIDLKTVAKLDESKINKVCQVIRKAYRDYWYKKKLLEKTIKMDGQEPWQVAAQRTLEVYKMTKPSPHELSVAAEKIQAAYKGYYIRKKLLSHLGPHKSKRKPVPEMSMPGPPIDVSGSREMELGLSVSVHVTNDIDDYLESAAITRMSESSSKAIVRKLSKGRASWPTQGQDSELVTRRHTRLASDVPEVIHYTKESFDEGDHHELTKVISFLETSPEIIEGEEITFPDGVGDSDAQAVQEFILSFGSTNDAAFSSALEILKITPPGENYNDQNDNE